MKNLIGSLFIFLLGAGLFSCTITKRHFGRGFYVEWHKKKEKPEDEFTLNKKLNIQEESNASGLIPMNGTLVENKVANLIDTNDYTLSEKDLSGVYEQNIHTLNDQEQPKLDTSEDQLHKPDAGDELGPDEIDNQKIHPLTWGMIVTVTVILISFFLIAVNPFFAAGVIICALLGLIFGIISLIAIKKNPEKYKLKKLTKVFSMISIIGGGIVLYAALLYFITMSS